MSVALGAMVNLNISLIDVEKRLPEPPKGKIDAAGGLGYWGVRPAPGWPACGAETWRQGLKGSPLLDLQCPLRLGR